MPSSFKERRKFSKCPLNGSTLLVPIIGDPIGQVKAPTQLTEEFIKRNLNIIVPPLNVKPNELKVIVSLFGSIPNLVGLIATAPYKITAYDMCTTVTTNACTAGAVSLMRKNKDNTWHGELTDGIAFVRSIEGAGYNPVGGRALLVGAGGVGRAIAFALLNNGIRQLSIFDIDQRKLAELIASLKLIYHGQIFHGTPNPAGFDLVINATPLGMRAEDVLPIDISALTSPIFVADVVTTPEITPLLAAARMAGCSIQTGVGFFNNAISLMANFFCGRSVEAGDRFDRQFLGIVRPVIVPARKHYFAARPVQNSRAALATASEHHGFPQDSSGPGAGRSPSSLGATA